MDKREVVTHVHMVSALFVPGLAELKQTLCDQHYPGIKMVRTGCGIACEFKGVNFFLPYHMTKCVVYEKVV